MHDLTPREIFDRALASEFGIELVLDDPTAARSVRRRLYAEREKLRAEGNLAYDNLSFMIRNRDDLWIVPRDRLQSASKIELLDCRTLEPRELPERILSRGRSRVGIKRMDGI